MTDTPDTSTSAPLAVRDQRTLLMTEGVALLAVGAALGFAYWPNLVGLVETWWREPNDTHGFLVLPIATWILCRLWPARAEDQPRVWLPGIAVVLLGLGLRAYFQSRGASWSETASLLVTLVGLGLFRLGPRTFRATWPAFAYLLFLFPLPTSINNALSQPLQGIATSAACRVLRLAGLWVMPEGNVIVVGGETLEVAAACNGLTMLMSLAAVVAATAALVPMANFKRLCLLVTIIPIALLSNVLRISATAWCYHRFGAKIGGEWAHDLAGWLMMPLAMAFVGLELMILSWLFVETQPAAEPVFGLRSSAAGLAEARQ